MTMRASPLLLADASIVAYKGVSDRVNDEWKEKDRTYEVKS